MNLIVAGRGPVTARARHLLDKPLLAVAGISLKNDDPELYKALQGLFDLRNDDRAQISPAMVQRYADIVITVNIPQSLSLIH